MIVFSLKLREQVFSLLKFKHISLCTFQELPAKNSPKSNFHVHMLEIWSTSKYNILTITTLGLLKQWLQSQSAQVSMNQNVQCQKPCLRCWHMARPTLAMSIGITAQHGMRSCNAKGISTTPCYKMEILDSNNHEQVVDSKNHEHVDLIFKHLLPKIIIRQSGLLQM